MQKWELKRNGSQPSGRGSDEYFTGVVRIDPLFQAPSPARVLGVSVTFEPGARTAWHKQSARADPDRHVRMWVGAKRGWPERGNSAGDVVWCPAGEKALARAPLQPRR